jgi:cobalt-zinc-cadmium resistance protein CzcA
VLRHIQERGDKPLLKAVTAGVVEVASPIMFCTLIVAFVLVPVLTLEGMEGRFFKPLALSMNFAMAGSVLMAIFFLPVLLFTVGGKISGSEKPERFFGFLSSLYMLILAKVLKYRRSSIFCCILIMGAVLPMALIPGVDFLPELDEGAIAVNVVRLPDASLSGSVETASFMERELLRFSEVKTVVSKTGRAEIAEDPMGPEQTDLLIMLYPQKEWQSGRSKAQLVDDMRRTLQKMPGMQFTFTQPVALRINELVSGIKSDLAIKVFGPDLHVLQELANEAAAVVHDLKGAHDVNTEPLVGISEIEIRPKRKELARYGLNVADLNELVESSLRGIEAGEFREQEMRFPIQVRLQESFRNSVEKIGGLSFLTPSGSMVLLSEVADLVKVESPAVINRENAMRRVAVECNIQEVDTGGFVLAAKAALSDFMAEMPAGYWLEFGGTYQNQQRAMSRLSVITPICILLIVVLLCTAFQELRPALIILAALPFALVGGVIALVYTGLPYNVPSIIGFIALFGLSIQDGTVLLSFAQQLKSEGLSHYEAIKKAAELRFRSLLMTTVTTVLGLFPLIHASGPGASILQPLAVVMTGGMISATALTLIILPVLYAGLFDHTMQKADYIPA